MTTHCLKLHTRCPSTHELQARRHRASVKRKASTQPSLVTRLTISQRRIGTGMILNGVRYLRPRREDRIWLQQTGRKTMSPRVTGSGPNRRPRPTTSLRTAFTRGSQKHHARASIRIAYHLPTRHQSTGTSFRRANPPLVGEHLIQVLSVHRTPSHKARITASRRFPRRALCQPSSITSEGPTHGQWVPSYQTFFL